LFWRLQKDQEDRTGTSSNLDKIEKVEKNLPGSADVEFSSPTNLCSILLTNEIIMVKVSVSIVEDFARQDRNLINVLSVGVEDHLGTCHDAS
jgi:hypothetical protein